MEVDHEISATTRFAEGFYNGLKFAICHTFTYGIYFSKEEAVKHATSFRYQYIRHIGRVFVFYPLLLSTTYFSRQVVLTNRDVITASLHRIHPIFKRSKALTEILMQFGIYLPLGIALNYI
jgi:hypothetical protein